MNKKTAEMPQRATTLGVADNQVDINAWNACYDAFSPYIAKLKAEIDTRIFAECEKVSQEYQRRIREEYIPKTIVEEMKERMSEEKIEKIIWSAEGNPDLTKQQVKDLAKAISQYARGER